VNLLRRSIRDALRSARSCQRALKWKKAAELIGRVKDLVGEAITGIKRLRKAEDELQAAASCAINSFKPGTLVLLADGTSRPIEKLKLGDRVAATDPKRGKTKAQPVAATIIGQGDKQLVELPVTTTGAGGATHAAKVTATDGHPFLLAAAGRVVDAGDPIAGDQLQALNPKQITRVTSVRHYTALARVHSLTIAAVHAYYVLAGNTPVLVHNCGGATFVADASGTVVPTSASRLEGGLQAAVDAGEPGFSSFPTRSAGSGFQLPDGSRIRIMQPSANGNAGLRASFTNGADAPISPFTGKPIQPPRGVNPKQYVRERTRIELEP
jgi:hypothetical protein